MAGGLALDESTEALIARQWAALAAPGTWLTGSERVAAAELARTARAAVAPSTVDGAATLTGVVADAVARIAADPGAITEAWVTGLETAGMDRLTYVELLGVVARITAIDTLLFAVGAPLRPLPVPQEGEPTRTMPNGARLGRSWVPMTGPAPALDALSAVPPEQGAQQEMAAALYIAAADIGDRTLGRELGRVQMELVVCRTSLINHCFY
ncbi:MAG: hypothetical protein AAGD35_01340 [Actinomycetota bacterium]